MPRFAIIAAFALLTSLLLPGCGRRDAHNPDSPTTVTLWTNWTGFEKDALDKLVFDFNASQNAIRVETLGVADIGTKALLATAGGTPPDLAMLGYFDLPAYVENNALLPLDRMASANGIRQSDFAPVFWDTCSYRGFLWAIPITASVTALHYSKAAFREAGLDPERPPRTLEELESMNNALAQSRTDGSLHAIGHLPNEPGWWQDSWALWFGGEVWDGQDHLLLDTPPWQNLANWLDSYPDRFGASRLTRLKSGFGQFASPQNPFFTGRLAMVMQGIWMDNFVSRYASGDFEYGVAPFPAHSSAAAPFASIAEPDLLCIPAGAQRPQEAMAFVAFLARPDNLERLALLHRKITSLKAASERFLDKHPHPYVDVFIEIANSDYVRTRPQLPQFKQYRNEMANAVGQILGGRSRAAVAIEDAGARQQRALERQQRRWNRVAETRIADWADQDQDPSSTP